MKNLFQRLNRRKHSRRTAAKDQESTMTDSSPSGSQTVPVQKPAAPVESSPAAATAPTPTQRFQNRPWRSRRPLAATFASDTGKFATPNRPRTRASTPPTDPSTPEWPAAADPLYSLRASESSLYTTPPRPSPRQLCVHQYAANRTAVQKHDELSIETAEIRNRITQEAADLDKRGNDCFERGEYDQAFAVYQQALQLKKQTLSSTQHEKQLASSRNFDQSLQQQQDNSGDDAEHHERTEKSILASVATSINNMTYLKQRSGQATTHETMASYLKSLQIKREILGPEHLSVGKTLNNIGSVFYLQRAFDPAVAAYKEAARIMTAALGADHLDVSTVTCNIGDCYCATNQRTEALEKYRQALPIRWHHLGPDDPKVVRLMEQISSLEMGILPVNGDDHLSDSEGEEFAEEDKQRHAEFNDDLRTLQQELEEDMKFFDLLERQAAIDMVKDKTRVFREMREISVPTTSNQDHSTHAPVAAHMVASGTMVATTIDLDVMPSVVLQPVVDSDNAASSTSTEAWVAIPPPEALDNMPPPALEEETRDIPVTVNIESECVSPAIQQVKTTAVAVAPAATSTKPKLSTEERHQALTSVRERLAKLRSQRGYIDTNSASSGTPKSTKPVEHRSYMEPTASSFAKKANPTRHFLGTPTRKKLNEGIQLLRGSSDHSGASALRQTTTTA